MQPAPGGVIDALRSLLGGRGVGQWHLETEWDVGWHRAQQADEVEPAFAGRQAGQARLLQQAFDRVGPRRRCVAQLHVGQAAWRYAAQLLRQVAAAIEMDRAERLAEGLPNLVEFVKVPKAGHSSTVEQPDAVTESIERFLQKVYPA